MATQITPSQQERLSQSLLAHPAFSDLSSASQNRLVASAKLVKFQIGQLVVHTRGLPAFVFVVIKGQVRLRETEKGRLKSLAKVGPGTILGLASLLSAQPIEEASSVSEALMWAIPTELLLELYGQEKSFSAWCNSSLWSIETYRLFKALISHFTESEQLAAFNHYQDIAARCSLVPFEQAKLALNSNPEDPIYLLSSNTNLSPLTQLNAEQLNSLESKAPFPPRLLTIKGGLLSGIKLQQGEHLQTQINQESRIAIPEAADFPVKTDVDIGQPNNLNNFKIIRAQGIVQSRVACFQMLARLFDLPFRRDTIEKYLRELTKNGAHNIDLQTYAGIASSLGLISFPGKLKLEMAERLSTPALIEHEGVPCIVLNSDRRGMDVASPLHGRITLTVEELKAAHTDSIDVLVFTKSLVTSNAKFGFNWFLPALLKYRGALIQVFAASFVVQLFTLANPLLIQVIIDKVINQRSLDTLQLLGISLVVVTLLEGVLTSLRTLLFSETTNRIDQRLAAEVIDHLLRLPLNYFDKRPVGDLATRVGELERIRGFLTGTALTTVLDAIFSVIYICVMVIYSSWLTVIALLVVPIQILITFIGAPVFRRQLRASAEANSRSSSYLVEVLSGVQTVKAQNVELISRWKWQSFYSEYIAKSFQRVITSVTLGQVSQVLQKLSQLLVIWVGASMVLAGSMTLGQLIAFRIISGYVTQPLLRLSSIWQNIQEIKVSFERLSDVLDTSMESDMADRTNISLPPITGSVKVQDLYFRFNPTAADVLRNINLEVQPGSFVGVVGQSGSGKSTLMKLIPRLYPPTNGRILIDGYDIAKVELYSLRRQIGIVPQDPLLFAGTVAENIALTQPDATMEEIVLAATNASAHDFIMNLPLGYSTPVGEKGASLSGGQRQRLAIARTLLSAPKMLILDEATSALDYQTEALVCNSLRRETSSQTVFFVTHRLPTVRDADLILFMEDGRIAEQGNHAELMAKRGGYFALYQQQEIGA